MTCRTRSLVWFLIKQTRKATPKLFTLHPQKLPQKLSDLLQNMCSKNFRNIHKKTRALESLFNKATGLQGCNFIKKRFQRRCFPVNIVKFKWAAFVYNTSGGYFLSWKVNFHYTLTNLENNTAHEWTPFPAKITEEKRLCTLHLWGKCFELNLLKYSISWNSFPVMP